MNSYLGYGSSIARARPLNLSPSPGVETGSGSMESMLDTANLAIQISVGIVTLVALLMAATALFGLREITSIRRRSNELKVELDQSTKARQALEQRLASFEADLESLVLVAHLFNEGQTAYAAADYDRAMNFYEEALQIQPNHNKIQVSLARCFVNKGMNSRAERLLRIATQADSNNGDAWRALSTSRRYVDLPEAISYAQRALELDGDSPESWNYLGLLLRDDGRFEEAVGAHEEAILLAPRDPLAYFYKALLLIRTARPQEAAQCLREAHAKVEALRKTNRIKGIWASTVEWAYRRHLDTPDQEEAAAGIATALATKCVEKRNRQAILSHMVFYLSSVGADLELDLSLAAFPEADKREAVVRAGAKGNHA